MPMTFTMRWFRDDSRTSQTSRPGHISDHLLIVKPMKQLSLFLSLLTVLFLAGCADTETPHPKKRSSAVTQSSDSQFTANAAATNANALPDSSLTDTDGLVTNAVANPSNPFATPTPVPVAAPRDLPYGTPVPGKPGFVTSPHSASAGYVDVRGFPPGSEVKDPYSGKIFLVP